MFKKLSILIVCLAWYAVKPSLFGEQGIRRRYAECIRDIMP